ncbi:hypothetical protein XFF6990_130204 [Xanthomonas citri pv. fuscans]|uniref:Uncharacterized protein n=1 Tax=Xanthomonas campestris pv. phaseoli TaxID=317013 RepID=A0A7Z7NIF2_XANCH|nr:hypothetical protein XFF6990_130204 [Xanthomonas citri pv. fuscans]SOO24589.1 hypothetical protein XFF6991_390037 [Xanthomonas phaseoli pv. phaseoli]
MPTLLRVYRRYPGRQQNACRDQGGQGGAGHLVGHAIDSSKGAQVCGPASAQWYRMKMYLSIRMKRLTSQKSGGILASPSRPAEGQAL